MEEVLEVAGPGRKDEVVESGWILGAPRPDGWVSKSMVVEVVRLGYCVVV